MGRFKTLLSSITALEEELKTLYAQLQQEKDNIYNAIVEITPCLVAIIQNEKLAFISPTGAILLLYKDVNEICGRTINEILHPDSVVIFNNYLNDSSNDSLVLSLLLKLRKQDGEYIDLEVNAKSIIYNNQTAYILSGICNNDIGLHQRTSCSPLSLPETVLNSFPELIAFYEPDHTIRWMNDAARKYYNIKDNTYTGIKCHEVRFGAQAPCLDCPMLTSKGKHHERVVHDRDTIWHVRHTPIFNEKSEISGYVELSIDITKKEIRKAQLKDSEAKIQESEQRFREIFEHSNENIFLLEVTDDMRFRNLDFNPAFERNTGRMRSEIIGKYQEEVLPEEIAKIRNSQYRDCVESKEAILNKETQVKTGNGIRTFSSNIIPIPDSQGKIYRLLGIYRDISEQKQYEERLKKQQTILEEAQRIGRIGSWELNFETGHIERSKEIYRIFELESAMDSSSVELFLSRIHPDDKAMVYEKFNHSIDNKKPYAIEYRLSLPDGRIKHVSESCETMFGPKGEPIRSIGTVQDITERKQMEDELARRERDFRTLAENAPDPIIRYDRQGRRIYINSIVEKVANTPSTAFLGQTPADKKLLGQIDSDKVRSSIKKVIETGGREVLEVFYSSPDGRERWLQTILVPEFGQDNRVESVLLIGRDIHEMKLHEQHLEQTLQFTDKIIDSIPEPVFIKDRQHRFILSNDAHCKFRGMGRDEFIGKTDFDHFPKENAKYYWDDEEEIFETGKETQYDDLKEDKLGNRIYFVLRKTCFTGSDGNKYLAGTIHYITERKIAEEKLRESEMQYRTLVENSPDVIVRYDRDCNRLFFNPAYQELSDYQASELIGTSPDQLSPLSGHQANLYLNTIKKVFESALSKSMEIQVYTPDNDFWYNMKAVPEFDEEGNVASVLAIGHDVTELKKSKQMSEMLNHALNKASDSFFIFKVGNPKFTYVNEQVYKSLGYTKEELDVMTLFDIDPLMDVEKLTALDSLLAQQPVVTIETIHKKKDGTIFPVENTISYYRFRETNYVFILSRDITERKQAEHVLHEERQLFIGGPNVAFKWRATHGWPIEYVSPNIQEQFGYQPIKLTESAALFLNLVHPDDLEKIIGDVSEQNQTLGPFIEQEFRIINAKGEYRWVYAFTVPVRGIDNEISHYKGYLTDISNRKHSEQALIESEQRYRLVFENSPVSIWEEDFSRVVALFDELKLKGVVDLEQYIELHPEFVAQCAINISITDVNNSALNLHYAKSKKELIENLAGTFTDESIEALKKELVHIWNGGTEMKIDTEVKTFTGEIRNVTVYFNVCPGYEGDLSKLLVSIVDITDRKIAESVIVQLNADLNATLMAVPDMLFEVSAKGTYINVWAKKENHLLLDKDRLIGQSVFDVLPPHAAEVVSKSMDETLEKGYSVGHIYYLDLESGRKWFELSVSKKTIFRTSEIHFIALVRDITDRKRVEKALLESQKRLIKAELIASIGHFEYDYKHGMSYWSEGAFEILSTPDAVRNSVSPVFLEMVVHREDSKRVQAALEDALKNNTKFDETYRIIDFVGNEKVIHSTGQVLVSNEGVPGNFFGIIQDVTMVYLLNNKLIAEEEKFRQLAENSPVGIFILKRETLLYANKPMMGMLEIESAEQLTIVNLLKLIHPDDRSKFQSLSKMLRNENYNKAPYRFAIRKVCLNGRIRHFDVQTTLFNVQGEDLIQFIVIDKTEDYENEQIRQQLAASTLYIDQKNKFTSEIESRLKIILSSSKKIEKTDFQPIIEVIRTYSQTDKDWELLRAHIDNIHPDFVVKLKSYCNTLSPNDIKHCSCIRLNLDTKEIARFFNVKPSSIQTSRVRLKKKFQLPDSIDLREFILGI